ncbi:MAG: hypothetical protein RBU37_24295, partial [Myxococcota bacterium]|nr:hypothetical protein [Myxococcota bacterium]
NQKCPINKQSQPGGGDSLRRQPEGCVPGVARNKLGKTGEAPNRQEVGDNRRSAQSTRSWGQQAKRPIDKKLGTTGEAPNRQEVGENRRSAQSTRKQAKCPIDKKSLSRHVICARITDCVSLWALSATLSAFAD